MYIAYYDETGDDGFPKFSSELFVLTATYIHNLNWKEVYNKIGEFRKQLKDDFNLPVKTEFHSRYFLLNKKPYKNLNISDSDRIHIINLFCELIALLEVRIINVVINKKNIQTDSYEVLGNALTYSVQRIENDLSRMSPASKYVILTDSGRVGKMRKTTRKIQRINFIPSKYSIGSYRKEIQHLIEDPLPKDSKESFFIQLSDLVSYIVFLY